MTKLQENTAKQIIREYVKTYLIEGKKPSGGLTSWFKERWVDISRKKKSAVSRKRKKGATGRGKAKMVSTYTKG